jgi:2-polyprenyl-6-hydroxyphenyl methylase/3-demethylubiquinone-9 3-methyltransferase
MRDISGYKYDSADLNFAHGYLLPALREILVAKVSDDTRKRIFELGCGNGSVSNALAEMGFEMIGVDPSREGIHHANERYPHLNLRLGSAYDALAEIYGQFPVVVSLEVIEHIYAPREYAATVYSLLEDGGTAIISTPYHGYWKNLAIAVTGRFDSHFTVLWDNGHIKFWSFKTLHQLLKEAGFRSITFRRVGRIPALAKSMIAIATK